MLNKRKGFSAISPITLAKYDRYSKRKAKYLLDNDFIPCENTGKKTRQYRVKLSDVNYYIEHPCEFNAGMFSATPNKVECNAIVLDEELTKKYYNNLLKEEKDVLTVADLVRITGYIRKTFYRWFANNKIPMFLCMERRMVRKADLYSFLISSEYTNITQKSKKHLEYIEDIKQLMEKKKQ